MATYGAMYPCFAKIAAESTSALPTYANGFAIGKLNKCDVSFSFASGEAYGDNALADKVEEFSSGSAAVETDNISLANQATLFGGNYADNVLSFGATDVPPAGGFAFYRSKKVNGVVSHEVHYYPKVVAKRGNVTANTKTDSLSLATESLSLTVMKPEFGKYEYIKEFATEADAKAYIQTTLGVAIHYAMDVQVNGAGTGDAATPVGTTMVASGSDFVVTITGTATKLYDNGVDNTTSIAGDKYTITSAAADHDIAIIF